MKDPLKKHLSIKPFRYKDLTKEEFVEYVQTQLPVDDTTKMSGSLSRFIKTMCEKYPELPKEDVTDAVYAIFETIRDSIIGGKIINIMDFFFDTKISIYTLSNHLKKNCVRALVRSRTANKLKKAPAPKVK